MLSSLPSLSPQDSYTLWYTPTHHAVDQQTHQDPNNHNNDPLSPVSGTTQNSGSHSQRRVQQSHLGRSPLARLRADELYMERRKQNVQNYGSAWIKPPGVFKSLYQLREEKREMEEHQEALRREQLAQELAEAEAEAEAEAANDLMQGETADEEIDEGRDLDDDIPEADVTGIGADDSEDEIDDPDDEDEVEDDDDDDNRVPRHILAQRLPEDIYREALARGEESRDRTFGDDGASITDVDDQSQMLQEEDLVHEPLGEADQDINMSMNMGADLDDDIPEAETGGYEHTDTEEELSSSEEDSSVHGGHAP